MTSHGKRAHTNYSIILEKYLESCTTIINDPARFVEGWLVKELNRQ